MPTESGHLHHGRGPLKRWCLWRDPAILVGIASTVLAAAPLLSQMALVGLHRPALIMDGDWAVDELALMRAGHLTQLVGVYSRFGFSEPGPAWYYALSAIYQPIGGPSWAFAFAVLALNALASGLIVALMWRWAGLASAVGACMLVLAFQAVVGPSDFRDPWPPFAPILPIVALLLLAAAGAGGSLTSAIWAGVAATYVLQLHIATAPVVACVAGLLAAVLAKYVWRRRRNSVPLAHLGMPTWIVSVLGVVLLTALWIPPLVDEFTGAHNITALWTFFRLSPRNYSIGQGISAAGSMLGSFPVRRLPLFYDTSIAQPSLDGYARAAAFLVATAGLALAGYYRRDRFTIALGLALAIASMMSAVSIRGVVGPLFPYLLYWLSGLSLALCLGWLAILAGARGWLQSGVTPSIAMLTIAALLAIAGTQTLKTATLVQPLKAGQDPGVPEAWRATDQVLRANHARLVLVTPASHDTWPMAAALVLQAAKSGRRVEVPWSWTFMFGAQSAPLQRPDVEIILVLGRDLPAFDRLEPGLKPFAQEADTYLFLRVRRRSV